MQNDFENINYNYIALIDAIILQAERDLEKGKYYKKCKTKVIQNEFKYWAKDAKIFLNSDYCTVMRDWIEHYYNRTNNENTYKLELV